MDGGKVKNREELEKLDLVAQKLKVKWVSLVINFKTLIWIVAVILHQYIFLFYFLKEKVEGHSGIKGNEMADRLANAGALKFKS